LQVTEADFEAAVSGVGGVVRQMERAGAESGGIGRNTGTAICGIPEHSAAFYSSNNAKVSRLGLEPRTLALKVPCSTN
jgi:hypothetical protein